MKKAYIILGLCSLFAFTVSHNEQLIHTTLIVTVRDGTGNVVEGAMVQLYKKEQDYLKEVHAYRKGITNKKGVIKLKKLDDFSYFILARKGDINNAGGGERIEALKKGTINKITVIIN